MKSNLLDRSSIFPSLTLAIITSLAYSAGLKGSFHLDDYYHIVNNPNVHIQSLGWKDLQPVLTHSLSRPVTNLSFALNYYMNRLNPFGFLLINLFIHILTVICLYQLIKLTLALHSKSANEQHQSKWAALWASLLWAVHPVHSEPVLYIIQRATLLATLFYLTAMLAYAKARLSQGKQRTAWYLAAAGSAGLAFGSKEIAATLPLAIILYEVYFLSDLDPSKIRPRRVEIITLLLIFSVYCAVYYYVFFGALSFSQIMRLTRQYHHAESFSTLQRLLSEPRVLVHYLSLLILPLPTRLTFDPSFPVSYSITRPLSTIPAILFCMGLFSWAVWKARVYPVASFAILWFSLTLSIESTIISLDLMAEHRLYLPSVVLALIVGRGLQMAFQSKKLSDQTLPHTFSVGTLVLIVMIFTFFTLQRSQAYRDSETLFRDTITKSPQNPRAHTILGKIYTRKGLWDEALQEYKEALNLRPFDPILHNNLAMGYLDKNMIPEAKDHLQQALFMDPNLSEAYYNIGTVLSLEGMVQESLPYFEKAVRLEPQNTRFLNNLGVAYFQSNLMDQAIEQFRAVLRLRGDSWETRYNLAMAFLGKREIDTAVEEFKRTIAQNPKHAEAHYHLGIAYMIKGDHDSAAIEFKQAVILKPNWDSPRFKLMELGRQ
jgi:tetratricopeptide (TPR) repeat protein